MHISEDGSFWNRCNTPLHDIINGIAYGNGTYVAVGSSSNLLSGFILTSTNGLNWENLPHRRGNALTSVYFGNGRFVACRWIENPPPPRYAGLLVSEDGINWIEYRLPVHEEIIILYGYFRGRFFARTANDRTFWSSIDGVNWLTEPNVPHFDQLLWLQSRFFGIRSPIVIWESNSITPPFTLTMHESEDGFRIDRVTKDPGKLPNMEIPYSISILKQDGSRIVTTNVVRIGEDQSSGLISVAPRHFAEATVTALPGEAYDLGIDSSATIVLPDGGKAPRFRRSGNVLLLRNQIRITLDAQIDAKVLIEGSTDLQGWIPVGTYTNINNAVELDLPIATNGSRYFYRARTLEQ